MSTPIDGNVKEAQSGEWSEKNLDCARKKLFVECKKKRLQAYRN